MSHGGVTTSGSTSSDDEVNIFQSSPNSAESSNTLNIFNSPSSHSKANKGATSPGKRVGQFFCNGTYGKPGATGTGSNTATQVPLEDVMRWKEFRRRQKELQDENLEVQIDAPTKSESLGMPCSSSDERQSSNDVKEVIDPLGFPSKELTVENVERGAAAEALTEIASNTMFSRLVANSEGSKKMGASVCETLPSETQKPGSLWNKKNILITMIIIIIITIIVEDRSGGGRGGTLTHTHTQYLVHLYTTLSRSSTLLMCSDDVTLHRRSTKCRKVSIIILSIE